MDDSTSVTDILVVLLSVLAVVVGLGLIGHALRARLGRTPERREWAAGSDEDTRTLLLMVPGGGALLAAAGFLGLTRVSEAFGPLVALFALLGVVPVLWAGLRLPVPVRLYPSWAREQRARIRGRGRAARAAGPGTARRKR